MADDTALRDFFLKVSEDPALLESYKKNPEEVLKRHGVSPDAARAIASGDIRAVREVLLLKFHPGIVILQFLS